MQPRVDFAEDVARLPEGPGTRAYLSKEVRAIDALHDDAGPAHHLLDAVDGRDGQAAIAGSLHCGGFPLDADATGGVAQESEDLPVPPGEHLPLPAFPHLLH